MAILNHRVEVDRRLRKRSATGHDNAQQLLRQRMCGKGKRHQGLECALECRLDVGRICRRAEHYPLGHHAALRRPHAPLSPDPFQRNGFAVAMDPCTKTGGCCHHAIGKQIVAREER